MASADAGRPFESDLVPLGGGVVLALARVEGLGSPTTLSVSRDDGGSFARVGAPPRIVAVGGEADHWLALTSDALHESRDGGNRWERTPLPSLATVAGGPWAAVACVDGPTWVLGGDAIVVADDGGWRRAYSAPPFTLPIMLTDWRDLGDAGRFVIGSPTRIYRVPPAGGDRLEDWSAGLPLPTTVGEGAPPLGRVGDLLVAGLYVRRLGDAAWQPLPSASGDRRLDWIKRAYADEWLAAPWAPDTWVGFSWDAIHVADDAGGLRQPWRASNPQRGTIKALRTGDRAAFASFRRAGDDAAGLRIDDAGVAVVTLVDADPRHHGA